MLSKYGFNKRLKKARKKYLLAAKNVSPYDGTTLQDTIEPALEYFSLFFSAENPLFKNEQSCLLESVKSIQDSIQKTIDAFSKYHQVFISGWPSLPCDYFPENFTKKQIDDMREERVRKFKQELDEARKEAFKSLAENIDQWWF